MKANEKVNLIDRGEAEYFHGREEEIELVKNMLALSKQKGKGISLLIQGPPGVGKTALLWELRKIGKDLKWDIRKMNFEALWNREELYRVLVRDKKYEKNFKEWGWDLKFLKRNIRQDKVVKGHSKIIEGIQKPIVLMLDEAQMIRVGLGSNQVKKGIAIEVLDQLHNLHLPQGLLFIMAGLGHTRKIFKDFEISRFNDDGVINLKPLHKKAERNILQDYLVQGAGISKKDPDLKHWIDRLSQESHQWPHHIICYGEVATQKLKEGKGGLSETVLSGVLKEGQRKKKNYYSGRFAELKDAQIASIFQALFENELQKNMISGSQVELDFERNPYIKDGEKLFNDIVARGVIQIRPDGFYQIPIPSMRTWMLKEYQRYLHIMKQKPSPQIQKLFQSL